MFLVASMVLVILFKMLYAYLSLLRIKMILPVWRKCRLFSKGTILDASWIYKGKLWLLLLLLFEAMCVADRKANYAALQRLTVLHGTKFFPYGQNH